MNLTDLRDDLNKLRLDTPHDEVLEAWLSILGALDEAKRLKADAEEWLKEWVDENGDLVFVKTPGQTSPEDKRWYVKTDRKVRQHKYNSDMLDDLLVETAGDVNAVANAMSSNAFKQGYIKSTFGEDFWREHYTIEEVPVVKDGKPTGEQRKVLATENVAFMTPARRRRYEEKRAG